MVQPERELAQKLGATNSIVYVKEFKEFARYNGGYFHKGLGVEQELHKQLTYLTEDYEYEQVYANGDSKFKPYILNDSKRSTIMKFVRDYNLGSIYDFDNNNIRITCLNGHVFPLGDTTFIEHFGYDENPYKTFMHLPVTYNPEAECLTINHFLDKLVGPANVSDLIKMIAYMLMNHVNYQKAFLMQGPPNTGKTRFYLMLLRFLGVDNVAQIKIQDLLEDRFALATIRDMRVMMWDDLPKKKLIETDLFRIIVTSDFIEARVMNVQKRAKFKNFCKMFYTSNLFPEVDPDEDDKFFRRWKLFTTPNVITEEERDPNLLEKLCTEEEFSGLLNRVIMEYRNLYMEGGFEQDIEALKGLWMIESNPIKLFVEECCELGEGLFADYEEFNYALNKFREERQATPKSKASVTQALGCIKIYRTSNRKSYKGIAINEDILAKYEFEPETDPRQTDLERLFKSGIKEEYR